jgi:hypothetical protein
MYHNVNVKLKRNGKLREILDPVSEYKPTEEESKVIAMVHSDMQQGRDVLVRGYTEFNDRSVIEEMNQNQANFNSYIPPRSDDPDESWRAQTVRPVTRNKLISIAAHVTAQILFPNIFAQNKKDEEDKAAAVVMRDLIEWVIDNSEYSKKFIQAVLGALTDPVVVVSSEYANVMRKVKEMREGGGYTVKEMVDEVMSGFIYHIYQPNEVYIMNAYENNIQKQRAMATRRLIDFKEAEAEFGTRENWKYVKRGMRNVFDVETSSFYYQIDSDLKDYLAEKVVYYNRGLDLKLTFINGVLMCDPENPIPRSDKLYPFVSFGYEYINNGNFFFYKSAANKLSSDQELIDTMYNMVMDGTFLALMPPMALYGSEEINSSVTIPGMVTSFQDPASKLENIGPRSDLRAGLEAIGLIEKSMSESSQDNSRQGISESGEKTAYEVSQLEKNAQIALGLFGKMIAFFVEDMGRLIVGDILQHLTVGEVTELTGQNGMMNFRSFLIPNKQEKGKKVTRKIQFTNEDYNKEEGYTEDELLEKSFKIMDEEGGIDAETKLYKVNPMAFRELKFKVRVGADVLERPNKNLEKALNLEAYDRLIQNPLIDQEAITRDFLIDVYKPGESDSYIKKNQPPAVPQGGAEAVMANTPNKQKGVNTNMVSQVTGNNSLKGLLK